MRYIDLNKIEIRDATVCRTIFGDLTKDDLTSLSITQLKEKIEHAVDIFSEGKRFEDEDVKYFILHIKDVKDEETFVTLVRFIVNTIMAMNVGNKTARVREKRLGLPTNFKDLHCDVTPIMTSLNCECIYNRFNISIQDVTQGWEYKLV